MGRAMPARSDPNAHGEIDSGLVPPVQLEAALKLWPIRAFGDSMRSIFEFWHACNRRLKLGERPSHSVEEVKWKETTFVSGPQYLAHIREKQQARSRAS
jgi:hypothetical protein